MKNTFFTKAQIEPYRFFFPAGIFFLFWGSLIWVPLLWQAENFPIIAHRYLMLNGFSASFIAGFLMSAFPQFAKAPQPKAYESVAFFTITLAGLFFAYQNNELLAFLASALQAASLLLFLFRRLWSKKENPPYSFLFIPAGITLWLVSAIMCMIGNSEAFKHLHYEGSVAAIILGVGSRLLPGILGHTDVVTNQRKRYETDRPYLFTLPLPFFALIFLFVASYFITDPTGIAIRSIVVTLIGIFYWRVYQLPAKKTALTWNIWAACWLIILSFILKAIWAEGLIHASHAFFFSGTVLLAFLVATRVVQSHGLKNAEIENIKLLHVFSFLVILAGATRVTAFLMPVQYLTHLAYSSITLVIAVGLWSFRYLRYINKKAIKENL